MFIMDVYNIFGLRLYKRRVFAISVNFRGFFDQNNLLDNSHKIINNSVCSSSEVYDQNVD